MSDVQNVVELLQIVFKHPFSSDWWNWKFKSNPAGFWGEEGDMWVAESNGRLIGYYAIMPERLKFGSETITVAQSVDTATHPDFRGMGVFPTLAKKVYTESRNRYRFIYGYPSEMAFKGFSRLGWKDFRIIEFIRFLDYNRPLKEYSESRLVIWFAKAFLKTFGALKSLSTSIRSRKYESIESKIEEVEQFQNEIDDFWKEAGTDKEIAVDRNAAFLNWRFSKRFGDYKIYIARSMKDRKVTGYMVVKKTEIWKFQNVLDIVDIIALSGEEKLISSFIEIATRIAKQEKLDLVHCRVPSWHKYAKILSKKKFVSLDQIFKWLGIYQPRFILYQYSSEKPLPEIERWFYSLADTDYA
jgi:GNAT superfamily N-acetyltransferase